MGFRYWAGMGLETLIPLIFFSANSAIPALPKTEMLPAPRFATRFVYCINASGGPEHKT